MLNSTKVNQQGETIEETEFFQWNAHDFTADEVKIALVLLAERQNLVFTRTNATKHGGFELLLRKLEQ